MQDLEIVSVSISRGSLLTRQISPELFHIFDPICRVPSSILINPILPSLFQEHVTPRKLHKLLT